MAARRMPSAPLPQQPEDDFQDSVLKLAAYMGWTLSYHTFDSRRSAPGYPDITLCKPRDGRLLIAELKSETGQLSEDQRIWIEGLNTVKHFDVRVWKPSDWPEIQKVLR